MSLHRSPGCSSGALCRAISHARKRGGTVNRKTAMSILAAANEPGTTEQLLFTLILLLGAGIVAWLAGVFRPHSIEGPQRLQPGKGFGLAFVAAIGMLVWIGSQILYVAYLKRTWLSSGHTGEVDLNQLSASDYAFLSTIPGLALVTIVLIGDRATGPTTLSDLGAKPGNVPIAIGKAILAMFID